MNEIRPPKKSASARQWALQDAKARLSEVVRRAREEGAQHITVHGRKAAVVLSEEDYRRLKGARSGRELVELLADSPLREMELEHEPVRGPVRDVKL